MAVHNHDGTQALWIPITKGTRFCASLSASLLARPGSQRLNALLTVNDQLTQSASVPIAETCVWIPVTDLASGCHSVPSGFSHVFVEDTNLAFEPLQLRKILPLTSLAPSSNVLLRLRRFGFIEETYKNDRVRMICAYVSRQGSALW